MGTPEKIAIALDSEWRSLVLCLAILAVGA
jgi:hypothetical protein